jgi:hypothetical protein
LPDSTDQNSTSIKLDLSIDEMNYIINVIGQRPYAEVFNLMTKIRVQVSPQLENKASV